MIKKLRAFYRSYWRKIMLYSLIPAVAALIFIEGYNFLSGYDDFSIQRELSMFVQFYIIAFIVYSVSYYRKKRKSNQH